jgi:hypothetical protein
MVASQGIEEKRSAAQSRYPTCQSASDGASPTEGLSAQDGALPHTRVRHGVVRGVAGRHHGAEPPSRQVLCGKSCADAGWKAFLTILSYTAACAGRSVIAVNPTFTSQVCSGCGVKVTKGLSVRWRACPDCGTSQRRVVIAAQDIHWRAAPAGTREAPCGDS